MPDYVIPQVEVFQDFESNPAAVANPLRAHITGPHAQLVRYADDDERPLGHLGTYDPNGDAAYLWPNRAAGAVVDTSYVKLYARNALLKYFSGTAGGAAGVAKVAGKVNRVRASGVNFKAHGDDFPRDADLFDRDVAPGDAVRLRFDTTGGPVTVWTYVSGFVGEAVAAAVGAATRDADNAASTGGATASHQQTRGPFNAVDVTAASAASYDPYPTGRTTETYTVIVTGSSAGGDFTTATLRVVSASGLDDVAEVTPSAAGSPTALGTHGATVTFDNTGDSGDSESADDQGVSERDLLAGQRWSVTVRANFTQAAAPTAAGTYTGTADRTYIVTVVTGNKFATGAAQVQVTTAAGDDVSGPTNVAAAATAIPIGSRGVTLSFSGTGLVEGDRFYVTATAAGEGAYKTLVLGNTLPDTVDDGDEADIDLYIKVADLLVPEDRTEAPPETNYDVSATEITVYADATAYDASWTDAGVPLPLPLAADAGQGYGDLYVEYRAWRSDLCHDVGTVDDVSQLDDAISGALTPDNPLKWAVFKALENSNGVDVKFTSVCDPDDVDSWAAVLELLVGRDDTYGLVPLTRTREVWDLFFAHVTSESAPEQGLWRTLWLNLGGVPQIPVVFAGGGAIPNHTAATSGDGGVVLATITDDAETSGTQYTRVTVPAGNGDFLTNGVRPGDVVRAQYTTDGFGNASYQSYVVDAVLTEETLRLVSGPAAAVNVAAKVEVWRTLTATEEAAEVARTAGTFGHRRVRCVWPDTIDTGGTTQEGYHLCAALAGLRSGILPHQGMTHLQVAGFDAVPRSTKHFNKTQLNTMAGNGVWIVTQATTASAAEAAGAVYTRHAVTTGLTGDLNQREEVVTSDIDSISFRFKDTFAPYIGVANVTPNLIQLIRLDVIGLIEVLKTEKATPTLGGQLVDAEIVALRQHLTLKDRIVLILNVILPYPLNNLEVHLVVPAATTLNTGLAGAPLFGTVGTETTTG